MVLAIALGLAIAFGIRPVMVFTPSSVMLPLTKKRLPAYKGDVSVLASLPLSYRAVGNIHMELHFTGNEEAQQTQMVKVAQKLAAAYGANAVWLKVMGHTAADSVLGETLVLRAVALKI